MGGFWPLVVMALLVGPMTYLAHRGLARFVLLQQTRCRHHGSGGRALRRGCRQINHPALLLRHLPHRADSRVGITNTVESFMVNQLQMTAPPRWILPSLIMGMMSVMLAGEN